MKPISHYIAAMLATLLGVVLTGCSSDHEPSSAESKMSISFRVETRNGGQTNAGEGSGDSSAGYEDATAWENYIDIDNDDYRIAFFDFENRCITPFEPTSIVADNKETYVDYTLEGKVPGILTLYSNFKIVVLANWGPDNYPEIKAGVTTIDNLCCPDDATNKLGQFKHFEGFGYEILAASDDEVETQEESTKERQRYVPMYGVKEYTGVTFGIDNENKPTVRYEENFGPVNMLRAIAKVEVVFDTKDPYELDNSKTLQITNYNEYGYCAPEGCYLEEDYYNNSWSLDYWQGKLHLVGGKNDSGVKTLAMTETTTAEGKTVWVAYLPEYQNVGLSVGETPARIAVPLIRGGETDPPAYIDFATYEDGEPVNPINIERNNLYRFTITHVDQGVKWKVEALKWNCLEHEKIVM